MNPAPTPAESARDKAYLAHIANKENRIRDSLAELGLESAFTRFHACQDIQGFRGRAHFSIEPGESGPRLCGIDPVSGPGPFEETRWVLPPFAQKVVDRVFERIWKTGSYPAINGFDLWITHGHEACHLSLTAQKAFAIDHEALAGSLLELPELIGVAIPSQRRELGESFLRHSLIEFEFRHHYSAFFQTNLRLTPDFASAVQNALGSAPIPELIDLYCGAGLHSIPASAEAARVFGADNHPAAIVSAFRTADG